MPSFMLCFHAPDRSLAGSLVTLLSAALIVPGELTKLFPDINGPQNFPANTVSMRQVRFLMRVVRQERRLSPTCPLVECFSLHLARFVAVAEEN